MSASDDVAPYLEYIHAPKGRRRSPKQLQNIGLEQFRNQSVVPKFRPGSAAALLHQKKVDQRSVTRTGRGHSKQAVEGLKAEDRDMMENGTEDGFAGATSNAIGKAVRSATESLNAASTIKDALLDETVPEAAKQLRHGYGTAMAASTTQPRNTNITTAGVSRRIKASPGEWGLRSFAASYDAARKVAAPAYPTTPTSISVDADGELIATVKPTPVTTKPTSQPTPIQVVQFDGVRTARRHSATRRWAKRNGISMSNDGSDDDSQDQNDFDDRHVPSGYMKSAMRRPTSHRHRRLISSVEETSNLISSNTKNTSYLQAPQQQNKVRFVSPFTPSGEDQTTDRVIADASLLTPTSSPSHAKENLDPGEISDDEDSELYQPSKLSFVAAPATTILPEHKPEGLKPHQQTPQSTNGPRRKGIATPPAPKRARVPSPRSGFLHTHDTDIHDYLDRDDKTETTKDVKFSSKKAKLQFPTSLSSDSQLSFQKEEKQAAPFRKKGIARKIVRGKK